MNGNRLASFVAPSKYENPLSSDFFEFDEWANDALETGELLRQMLTGRRILEPIERGDNYA